MVALEVASDFGCIVLVVVASFFVVHIYLGINVGRARKKYGVKYPAMYSDKEPVFNCYQRAHQNTLEGYPFFLVSLILGGLMYPRVCALAGVIWLASRIVYAQGYYTGVPEKRQKAAFGYIGLFTNLISSVLFGLHLLGWW